MTLKEGNVFQTGYNEHLDELRILAKKGKDFILDLEAKERERTGVKSLKIGYNRVFGYYIEVRNGNLSAIKDEFGFYTGKYEAKTTYPKGSGKAPVTSEAGLSDLPPVY